MSGAADLVQEVTYSVSTDNTTWAALLPTQRGEQALPYFGLEAELRPSVRARFVRIAQRRAHVPAGTAPAYLSRVLVKELSLWGTHGPFGPLPRAADGDNSIRKSIGALLGINSIWGFFSDVYADRQRPGWGTSCTRPCRRILGPHSTIHASAPCISA